MSGKSGGSQSFREFTSEEGKFKVEMPGSPSRETVSAHGLTMISFQVEEKDGAYGVAYADIPMLGAASSALITRALDSARDNMVSKVNGKFTGESRISLDGKYPGREIRADIPEKNGLIQGRLYLVKDRVYMVMVVGLPGWVNSANAKRFLDSLELTK
jgi:hypothetical protein